MGNSVCCLVILVIFIGLGRAYGLGEILKSSCEGEGGGGSIKMEWNKFYGGRWPLITPCKDFNLAIVGGLFSMK